MKPWDRTPNANQQTGISLIELMIALTLSSLLMLGVMRMFMDSTRSSATDSALVQVQDSARIAMEMIKRDVRMAGYRGSCVSADAEPTPGSIVDFDRQSVTGIEDDKIGVDIVSDTLSILRAEEWSIDNPVRITSFYDTANADNNTIDLTRAITTTADEVLLISDCRQIAALNPVCADFSSCSQLTANETISFKDYVLPENCTPGNSEDCPLLYSLGTDNGMTYSISEVGLIEDVDFDDRRKGSDGSPIFALYRNGEEMVEGVENLQVIYGVENNNQTQYCDASTLADASACPGITTHIRISLIVASSNNVNTVNQSQTFDILNLNTHNTLTTNDRRLRRAFTTTIQLRNQG